MFKLKFKTLEEIPEKFRSYAVKEGEEFVVDTEGLLSKNEELLGDIKKNKAIIDKVKGLDVDAAKKALIEMATLDEQKAALDGRIQAALQEQARNHQTVLDKVNGDLKAVTGEYENVLVRSELGPVVRSEGGEEAFLMPELSQRVKVVVEGGKRVVKVIDDKGNPRLNDKGVPMTAKELVGEYKKHDIYSKAFKAPDGGGSGAPPNGGQGGGATEGLFKLTETQARDRAVYVAMQTKAQAAGQQIQIIPG